MEEAHRRHEADAVRGAASACAQLGDCADGLHAATFARSRCARRARRRAGAAAGPRRPIACRCARDGVLVAARDRAGQRRARARARPSSRRCVRTSGASRRARLGRLEAGAGGDLLGRCLERDQEVRGDRGGGVVGGAVVVGELERRPCRALARARAPARAPRGWSPAMAQPRPRRSRRPRRRRRSGADGGRRPGRRRACERGERGGAARVAHERPRSATVAAAAAISASGTQSRIASPVRHLAAPGGPVDVRVPRPRSAGGRAPCRGGRCRPRPRVGGCFRS